MDPSCLVNVVIVGSLDDSKPMNKLGSRCKWHRQSEISLRNSGKGPETSMGKRHVTIELEER